MELQKTWDSQNNVEKKEHSWKIYIYMIKTYNKPTLIKILCYGLRIYM